jgi:hypothetical protein
LKDYREWEKIEKQLDVDDEKEEEEKIEKKETVIGETSVNSSKNKLLKTLSTNVNVNTEGMA